MAKTVFVDGYVSIGGNNLSSSVKSATLAYSAEAPDGTTLGALTHTKLPGGLKDWTLTVEFMQDFAVVDAALFALVGTSVAIELRSSQAGRSASNPAYTGNAILTQYQPLGASVGEVVMSPVTLVAAGALTRAIV